jgi:HEPN domain-containing protein
MKEKVRYWTDTAQYDLDTARAMLEARRFLYVGFMCHQTIEKVLKGFYVYTRKSNPPYTPKSTASPCPEALGGSGRPG